MNVINDTTSGEMVCLGIDKQGCGNVLLDHGVNQGAEKRNFEGEEVMKITFLFFFIWQLTL
jgi:hypothetical protein